MQAEISKHIGAYNIDAQTGRWTVVGASAEMNEALNARLNKNVFRADELELSHALELPSYTSDNYNNICQPMHPMPENCYGTSYGYSQVEKINGQFKTYFGKSEPDPEEIKDFFKDCCRDMRVVLCQERKTTGVDADANRQIILDTYEQFRRSDFTMAKLCCDEEGKAIAEESGRASGDKDWVYYNSYYYFRSEELRDLFKEAAAELSVEWEVGETDVSERDEDKYLSYSGSFNEAWNNGSEYGNRRCRMIDTGIRPQEDFSLFYREYDEKQERVGLVQLRADGKTETKRIIFDIFNDEEQQRFPQKYNLYDLLGTGKNAELDSCLKNFDIFTRYYGTVMMRGR